MPGAIIATYKLQNRATAPDEKMRRHAYISQFNQLRMPHNIKSILKEFGHRIAVK